MVHYPIRVSKSLHISLSLSNIYHFFGMAFNLQVKWCTCVIYWSISDIYIEKIYNLNRRYNTFLGPFMCIVNKAAVIPQKQPPDKVQKKSMGLPEI